MVECSLWGRLKVDPKWRSLGRPFTRARYTRRALWWRPETRVDLQRFLAAASGFYHALAAATGASVIVDSSKIPTFAALLTRAPGLKVHAIHMVRDLRGVVSSGLRSKAYIPATPASICILQWYWANVAAEFLKPRAVRFSRLRYEDFVVHPWRRLEELASSIAGLPVRCAFLSNRQAQVGAQHHALGSPDKFHCGDILLRERKPELGPMMKNIVSFAGAPLLGRYGYFSKTCNRPASESAEYFEGA